MKFSTTIIALGLTALGFITCSNSDETQGVSTNLTIFAQAKAVLSDGNTSAAPDFIYDIDSRFGTSISKEKLHKAKSISDILPKRADWTTYPIQRVKVILLHDDSTETTEIGENLTLNEAQSQLLRSTDYSDSFRLIANCKGKHKEVPDREVFDLHCTLTVTPEKEAEYRGSEEALIAYLKKKSRKETAIVKEDQLERGQVIFTVTKDGTVANVKLTATSGYSSIDKTMVKLLNSLPRKWTPATNARGEKVDQEFVFSFGQGGC